MAILLAGTVGPIDWLDRAATPNSSPSGVGRFRERPAGQQGAAGVNARAAHRLADGTVTVMVSVPRALLGAGGADPNTRLEQGMDDGRIPVGGTGEKPRRGVAHIRTVQAFGDTHPHSVDVRLGEVRIRTRGARLETCQAGI